MIRTSFLPILLIATLAACASPASTTTTSKPASSSTTAISGSVIVAGHVAGVVLAHDRALADFGSDTSIRSQYAMLGLMVLLTGLGLTILAAG